MTSMPIAGRDAELYIANVASHGIERDVAWLFDEGRLADANVVLDVGCGTGALSRLAAARGLVAWGIEMDPTLASHAAAQATSACITQGDFLEWRVPESLHPDAVVMSFYLHHQAEPTRHIERARALLGTGGRLLIFDRIAVDDDALREFETFWREHYLAAHEWHEEMPRLMTAGGLVREIQVLGGQVTRSTQAPHDLRVGTARFPKTLVEIAWGERPRPRIA